MSNVTQVGHRSVQRGKMKWSFGEKASAQITYSGPSDLVFNARPIKGTALPEYPGLVVMSVEIRELDGDASEMDVNFELPIYQPEDLSTTPLAAPEYEISFNQSQVAIRCHPKCGVISGGSVQDQHDGVTIDDVSIIEKNKDYYRTNGDDQWDVDTYLAIRKNGVEDYLVAAPEVSRTLYYMAPPLDVGEDCFKRESPPVGSFSQLTRYDWLKGPDITVKQGRIWRRETKWLGAELVGSGPSAGGGWNQHIYEDA